MAAVAALVGLLGPALSTAAPPTQRPAFAPGRILVEAKAGATDGQFKAALAAHGGRSLGKLLGLKVHMVALPPGQSEEAIAARLARHPHIKFAELDKLVKPSAMTNDPLLGSQWHLPKIDAPAAWDSSNGTGTIIAILDTGVDSTHPDLAVQMVSGWNFYDNNSDTSDVHGHGTAVAGAAAAVANNGAGVGSVAWGARLMPIRVSDPNGYAYGSTIAQALTWAADNNARVANISFDGVAQSYTIESAAQYMRGKGGVVVVSAGNNGIDEGIAPSDAMIVVSATDSNDAKTSWSSYGSFVDLAAPGLNILTTKRGGGYWYCWGTSFASPIVAGVAAQLKSMRPNFTASQIESALLSSADDLGTTGKDSLYGYGRVNAARAVAAIGTTPVDATAPAVNIAAPTAGTVSGTVTVSVSASDNVGVARVDLMVNGKLFGSTASAPFDFVWNTANMPNGSATLSAVAYDAAGNNAVSAPGRVTVSNYVTDTTAPTVAITSPSDGSSLGRMTNVTATASDDNGLAWAQLTIDGEVVASSTSGDLRHKWNTRKVKSGSHTISVSAADTAGNTASTSIVVRQ